MLKKLLELFRGQVFLAKDVQDNKESIARLRQEFDELSDLVMRLQYEVRSLREEERHEREKLVLSIENALLKFERRLPPAKGLKKLK
jgi:predicted  nucleic acid-binding Zn-ribbon protein